MVSLLNTQRDQKLFGVEGNSFKTGEKKPREKIVGDGPWDRGPSSWPCSEKKFQVGVDEAP